MSKITSNQSVSQPHFQDVKRSRRIPHSTMITANTLAKIAVLAFMVANLPQANAGPIAYTACVAACGIITGVASNGMLLPVSVQACIKACWPAFAAATP